MERAIKKVLIDPHTKCWNWTGAKFGGGYGVIKRNCKHIGAHRFFYEHFIGIIPKGMELDHKCKNIACVNPFHLRPCTHMQNSQYQNKRCTDKISCFKGVHWNKRDKLFYATIRHGGKSLYIGCFKNIIEAAQKRDAITFKLRGEFASLNFSKELAWREVNYA